jgi:hypothetical protein
MWRSADLQLELLGADWLWRAGERADRAATGRAAVKPAAGKCVVDVLNALGRCTRPELMRRSLILMYAVRRSGEPPADERQR